MHKIYEDNGIFNIIYQIANIIYSFIISFVITEIVKYFSLSEKNVLKIKNEENIDNLDKIAKDEINCLNKKFIIFFTISSLLFMFFWYYLGCFCAVYKNTQIILIKDTLISFGLSLFYSIFINLIPGIFRIPSLNNENRDCIYKISKFIQIILLKTNIIYYS